MGDDELGHPFRAGRRTEGIDDDDDFGLRQIPGREHRAQGRVFSRQAVVRRHDAMQRPQRVRRQHAVRLRERRGTNQLGRSVRGAAIGIDHDRPQAWKIASEAQMDGAHDVRNRRGIVQGRQADEDVHLPHRDQLSE